jgi:hypothetical protein
MDICSEERHLHLTVRSGLLLIKARAASLGRDSLHIVLEESALHEHLQQPYHHVLRRSSVNDLFLENNLVTITMLLQ